MTTTCWKNTSIEHNKYGVNPKIKYIDDISFREVFFLKNQSIKIWHFLKQDDSTYVGNMFMKHSWTNSFDLLV
jgi:hypothetical protein